jgi:hypothetical protein
MEELNEDDVAMYSVAMAWLTAFIFKEMEIQNYDTQQQELVQNLFAEVIDRANTGFPVCEISAAVKNIPPVASRLLRVLDQQ